MGKLISTVSVLLILATALALLPARVHGRRSPKNAFDDVGDHRSQAQKIIYNAVNYPLSGIAYSRLAEMTDTFGPRLSGTQALEDSIDWVVARLQQDGFDNVHTESVQVPNWRRGHESLQLLSPRTTSLAVLGLGFSIGTPSDGIIADVLVVNSFDELTARAKEAVGKIVVFNQPYVSYGVSVDYRVNGASAASRVGAVAALVRSVTPFSVYSVHTGVQHYQNDTKQIPVASITVEDAEMMHRMQRRGQRVTVELTMGASLGPPATSRNIVADITGSQAPEEVVVISGHQDSWDVGQGALDDGGGAFVSWQALKVLQTLGLRPKRTIRLIFWTCEEFGGIGGEAYFSAHQQNITDNYVLAIESDNGIFTPTGFAFDGNDEAFAIMQQIGGLLDAINATSVIKGGGGTDIDPMTEAGVPSGSPTTKNQPYFIFHHTHGDMMTAINSTDLDLASAVLAVFSFVVADIDQRLPK